MPLLIFDDLAHCAFTCDYKALPCRNHEHKILCQCYERNDNHFSVIMSDYGYYIICEIHRKRKDKTKFTANAYFKKI